MQRVWTAFGFWQRTGRGYSPYIVIAHRDVYSFIILICLTMYFHFDRCPVPKVKNIVLHRARCTGICQEPARTRTRNLSCHKGQDVILQPPRQIATTSTYLFQWYSRISHTDKTKTQKNNSRDPVIWAPKLVSLLWIEHSTSRFSD